jgi:IPT/TIG domain
MLGILNRLKSLGRIATETGGVWGTVAEVTGPAGIGVFSGLFSGVSCTSAAACTAVGADGSNQPIYSASMFAPPTITSFSPASGAVGTVVTIWGTALDGATKVTVNGVSATITVDKAAKIKITVPAGATTGKIKEITPGGKTKSATVFTVTSTRLA